MPLYSEITFEIVSLYLDLFRGYDSEARLFEMLQRQNYIIDINKFQCGRSVQEAWREILILYFRAFKTAFQ